MRKLLLASTALFAMTMSSYADITVDLGANPDSGTGAFANTNPGTGSGGSGAFIDNYTFQLTGPAPQFLVVAVAQNVFGAPIQFISGFTGAVVSTGADGVIGGVDDTPVIGPNPAGECATLPTTVCQGFAGSAFLDPGNYYLQLSGDAASGAGYGGNLATFAVPGPTIGAGLPGLLAVLGMGGLLGWRKRWFNFA